MSDLKPCACGQLPATLEWVWLENGQCFAHGNCCQAWAIHIATISLARPSQAEVARQWNAAPRGEQR